MERDRANLPPNCERWMWIELIGFDRDRPDYNVPAFLDNAGFVPQGLSILLTPPDFVHTHLGLDREVVLPPDYCSYGGKPYNAERERQPWTNHDFRGLVQELQRHGIKVFFSLFNMFISEVDGAVYRSPWCDSHPELMEFMRDGQAASCLNPLKRFASGAYYEDVFAAKLGTVVQDYGFDGFHIADGYSCPRLPIWMADYSDDMVEQFVAMMDVALPGSLAGPAVTPEQVQARADCIWGSFRHEWCEFYARRFESLFAKICTTLHDLGRETAYNNAWTRDPFEAYDRYGVDYRRVARAGVDRFFMETVGAGVSIGAESGYPADPRFDFNFMLAYTKACLPDMPLLPLNCTGDTTENWDVLNHAPAVSEREIYTLGHTFVQDQQGFQHASTGPFICLADGINHLQWQWLRENWVTAYEAAPGETLGATVVWSEAALDAEIEDYPRSRALSRQKIAAELQKRNAPLHVVLSSRDLSAARGCLLVPRPELLAAAELAQVMAYRGGPVMTIGRQEAVLPEADLTFAEGPGPDQLVCRVYNAGANLPTPEVTPVLPTDLPEEMPNPPNYLHDLYFRPVSAEFLQAAADLLIALTPVPKVVGEAPDLRVLAFAPTPGTIRLLVGNEAHIYVLGRVDVGREVKAVRIASHFPGKPIYPDGQYVDVRVPPRGMIVLDLTLA